MLIVPHRWGHSRRREVLSAVQPHLPLLRLLLRLALIITGVALIAFIIFRDAGQHLPTPSHLPWNPLSRHRKAPPASGEGQDGRAAQDTREEKVSVTGRTRWKKGEQEVVNQDPNYPRVREWLTDHIYYSFYDGQSVYTNQMHVKGDVTRKPLKAEIDMFAQVLDKAVAYLGSQHPGRYKRDHCYSIRYRTVPTAGLEADVTCRNTEGEVDRVSVLVPFTMPRVLYHHHHHHQTIVIVIPLQGNIERLQLFLANLKGVLESGRVPLKEVGLCVVYFSDSLAHTARRILEDAPRHTPNLRTEFILLEGSTEKDENGQGSVAPFSRGRGLQVGAERTQLRGEVLFFCDVDVMFKAEFLTRCLVTPVKGHQVYFPILFSLYNPSFVYPLHKHRVPTPLKQMRVHDNHGYWRLWGHGMVCVYKTDFLSVGGFDQGRTSWGGEDLKLHRQFVHKGSLKVIRSLDPGLFHLYHPKNCDMNSASCLKVRGKSEASQVSLGLWYFKRKENVSVFGVLAEGNQPHDPHYDDADEDLSHHDVRRLRYDPDAIRADSSRTNSSLAEVETGMLWEFLLALVLIAVICLDLCLILHNCPREKGAAGGDDNDKC